MSERTTESPMQGPLESKQRRPITEAAGIDPTRLSERPQHSLNWLAGLDAAAQRSVRKKPARPESAARTHAVIARYVERWGLAR